MTPSDIIIEKKGNFKDYHNYGIYLLRFKTKVYIGCAYDQTLEERSREHIAKSITGTTPKDKQLRDEGGCVMEILYLSPNKRAKDRKKLLRHIERYLIYKAGKSIIDQLIEVDIVDDTLKSFKDEISQYLLNYQY